MSKLYIGLMSGTSLDGVDASLVRTNGINDFSAVEDVHIQYPADLRNEISALFYDMGSGIAGLLDIEKRLTEFHIIATEKLLEKAKMGYEEIAALGFHGQTIFHNPDERLTMQIGNPHLLAQKTGIDVVHDFRRRDVALGGQGAPLIPIFHKLLARNFDNPVVMVNIGGVANLTYIDENSLIAFDTGPGNALIDDICKEYFDSNYDDGGEIAAEGNIDYEIVGQVLKGEYMNLPYPKSLDRNDFKFLEEVLAKHDPSDMLATLTYITSATIAHSIKMLPKTPLHLFICGGGGKNKQMIEWLNQILIADNMHCHPKDIHAIDSTNSDYVESQGFAYLAARFLQNLPSAFPSTTNASEENICGCFVGAS